MQCLDENELLDLSAGSLDGAALAAAEEHLDGCADCRFLLAELLEPDRVRAPSWDLPVGERVGRYAIVGRIGVGGMGTVYAAYDLELRRKVALKLLHTRSADAAESDGAQLQQEAKAMARLHHANILAVHEVEVHGGHVYLAMELVEGESLRTFLRGSSQALRPLHQICQVFAAAGAGLSAAHRAGLLHCDFKPDNVLCGADGRTRVTDFGLARFVAERDHLAATSKSDSDPGGGSSGGGSLPYMAPEQLRDRQVSAASDQWSFCVALYEAVYDQRPFSGRTAAELLHAIEQGPLVLPAQRPASSGAVPPWLRALLQRGLSLRPQERFPSMDALLDGLAQRPARRARKLAALLFLGLVLACAIWTAHFVKLRPLKSCQAAAQNRWRSLALPPAPEWTQGSSWPRLQHALSAQTDRWAADAQSSCLDTWERHSQSAATQDLRVRCAQGQRFDLLAIQKQLSLPPTDPDENADVQTLTSRLLTLAERLPGPARCSAARVLVAPNRDEHAACRDGSCERVRELIATARVRRILSASTAAEALLSEAMQLLGKAGDASLRAAVQLEKGQLLLGISGQAERGRQEIKEALWLAQRTGDDELVASCWVRLLEALSTSHKPQHIEEAQHLLPHALAAVSRIGGDVALDAELHALAARLAK